MRPQRSITMRKKLLLAVPVMVCLFCASISAAFTDPVGTKVLLAGLGKYEGTGHSQHTIAYGNNRAYVIYSQITGQYQIDYSVAQYDFTTGQWTSSVVARNTESWGNVAHNSGTIVRDPQGYLEIFYGAVDALVQIPDLGGDSPYYKRSLNPDDITAWTPQVAIPRINGVPMPEGWAAYSPNGYLHVMLGHCSGNMNHWRRDLQGNWSMATLIQGLSSNDQAPAYGDWKIVGNTIHFVWSVYQPPFSGTVHDVYYAQSTDNGDTWTNIDGTASFTRTQGLTYAGGCNPSPPYPADRIEAPCEYPAAYKVAGGPGSTAGFAVDALSDGTVLITNFTGNGPSNLYVWSGSNWVSRAVDPGAYWSPAMEVTSDDAIFIYAPKFPEYYLSEFISRDRGLTWETTLLDENDVRNVCVLRVSPPGQSDRILVAWNSGDFNTETYDAVFMSKAMTNMPSGMGDIRPASSAGTTNPAQSFLKITPNPAGTVISIKTDPNHPATVEILNLQGKRVEQFKNVQGGLVQWQRRNSPAGVYFVKASSKGVVTTAKLFAGN